MPFRLYSMDASTPEGMKALESCVATLLHCSDGKCNFLRSSRFITFRLKALYKDHTEPFVVYGEGLKLVLTKDKQAEVYINEPPVDEDLATISASDGTTGKRKEPTSDEER